MFHRVEDIFLVALLHMRYLDVESARCLFRHGVGGGGERALERAASSASRSVSESLKRAPWCGPHSSPSCMVHEACGACGPGTPLVSTHTLDPAWRLGQWRWRLREGRGRGSPRRVG